MSSCDCNKEIICYVDDMKGLCRQCMYQYFLDKYGIEEWTISGVVRSVYDLMEES